MGEVCSQGSCSSSCGGGTTKCGSECVDNKSDPRNCGACGKACKANEVCMAGACASSCAMGTKQCGMSCVDTQTDRTNCGMCGNLCGDGQICSGGMCQISCQQGLTKCPATDAGAVEGGVTGDYCANLLSDNNNCGTCGKTCGASEKCQNGKCLPPTCVTANGLLWCWNPASCGQPCNAICQNFGLQPVANKTTWFNAQNTMQLCQNISVALGLGNTVNFGGYTYACVEDAYATHTGPGPLVGPILCSSDMNCPNQHVTNMDQLNVACGVNSRRAICPCE